MVSIALVSCVTAQTPEARGLSSDSTTSLDGSYAVRLGPVDVPPGSERTVCVLRRLTNSAPLHVGAVNNELAGSHHLVVYRVSDTEERTIPFECKPFTDTLDPAKGSPLVLSQREADQLVLPPGVAFTMDPNQMLRLELHVVNASAAPRTFTATTTLRPVADYRDEASLLFVGDLDVVVPPRQTTTLGPVFFSLGAEYASAKFFAFTGHEHQLGTNVRVWTATSESDPGVPAYDVPGWTWSEPAMVVHDPPISLPPGGGFKLRCDWQNPTGSTATFDESASGEMCFFWAYYYPSQGPHACVRGSALTGGATLCCPGESPLCDIAR